MIKNKYRVPNQKYLLSVADRRHTVYENTLITCLIIDGAKLMNNFNLTNIFAVFFICRKQIYLPLDYLPI